MRNYDEICKLTLQEYIDQYICNIRRKNLVRGDYTWGEFALTNYLPFYFEPSFVVNGYDRRITIKKI